MGKSKDEAIKDAINKITKLEPQKKTSSYLEQKEEVLNKLIGGAFDCFATSKISANDLVDKKGRMKYFSWI